MYVCVCVLHVVGMRATVMVLHVGASSDGVVSVDLSRRGCVEPATRVALVRQASCSRSGVLGTRPTAALNLTCVLR